MKETCRRVLGLCCLSVLVLATAHGQPVVERKAAEPPRGEETAEPVKVPAETCELLEVPVRDSQAAKYVYVLRRGGQVSCACLTVEAVKNFISSLPAGSTLSFTVNDLRSGGELTGQQVQELQKHCTDHHVEMIIHPGG